MFTHKDVEYRSIFVINCLENKNLCLRQGELLLEKAEEKKPLTKFPFQKILAIFAIGHISITSALIEKCTRHGVPVVVMKPNFRPVFFFSITAEANFLLRKKQYAHAKEDLLIPKILVENKIRNQIRLLEKTRLKTQTIQEAVENCSFLLSALPSAATYDAVMGTEGKAAKFFFPAYYEQLGWRARFPRAKIDPLNATLDIGYTMLFNYIEAFTRLFGFDPYQGVYHCLWFKRKSLICDLVEPFRCLIDQQVRKAFNRSQCKIEDFDLVKGEYILKREKNADYTKMFFEVLIERKNEVFKYVQQYYRCFMQDKKAEDYPRFLV